MRHQGPAFLFVSFPLVSTLVMFYTMLFLIPYVIKRHRYNVQQQVWITSPFSNGMLMAVKCNRLSSFGMQQILFTIKNEYTEFLLPSIILHLILCNPIHLGITTNTQTETISMNRILFITNMKCAIFIQVQSMLNVNRIYTRKVHLWNPTNIG